MPGITETAVSATLLKGLTRDQKDAVMTAHGPLSQLSIDDLCTRCREQTLRFRRHEESDDSFCFEVFRRAVSEHDEACWQELDSIYHDLLLSWCRRAGADDTAEEMVAETWARFWQNFGPAKIAQAESVAAIQRYLKMCAYTAVHDAARKEKGALSLYASSGGDSELTYADSLVDDSPTPEELVTDESARSTLREIIDEVVRSDEERAVLHLKFELGLTSAEVQARRPDIFPSVSDVYRVTRNFQDRLRRSPAMVRWLDDARK